MRGSKRPTVDPHRALGVAGRRPSPGAAGGGGRPGRPRRRSGAAASTTGSRAAAAPRRRAPWRAGAATAARTAAPTASRAVGQQCRARARRVPVRRRRPAGRSARPAAPRRPRSPRRRRRRGRHRSARSRKWCTVLCTRRPSATNQKSMMPSGATTSPMIPVSSATSRTAVSSGVSPASMCPLGSDQRRRPRRSVRPMRAARGPVHAVVGDHQAPGGGLVDPAQPAAGASAPARPSHARRVARPAALPWLVVSATPRVVRRGARAPGRPADRAGAGRALPGAHRARASASPRPASRCTSWADRCATRCWPPGAGRGPVPGDLDLTTDARPEQVLELLRGWAGSTWNTGIAFGTVGAEVRGVRLEITTFRADRYDRESRNPEVAWGDSLVDDLARRDFTVNAMAVSLGPDRTVTDPFGGLGDLLARRLRTPGSAGDSFADDPLRMLRAVRFVAQLGLTPDDEVVAAMTAMSGELARITAGAGAGRAVQDAAAGRARGRRWSCSSTPAWPTSSCRSCPRCGWRSTSTTSTRTSTAHSLTVLDQAIELEKADPDGAVAGPGAAAGRAAARHRQAGHPAARAARPGLLPPPRGGRGEAGAQAADGAAVPEGRRRGGLPADLPAPAVPRLRPRRVDRLRRAPLRDRRRRPAPPAAQAGPLGLARPATSGGPRRCRRPTTRSSSGSPSSRATEDLARVRPDLDGNAIMELLGLRPGPEVGPAWRFLKDLRLERGPLSRTTPRPRSARGGQPGTDAADADAANLVPCDSAADAPAAGCGSTRQCPMRLDRSVTGGAAGWRAAAPRAPSPPAPRAAGRCRRSRWSSCWPRRVRPRRSQHRWPSTQRPGHLAARPHAGITPPTPTSPPDRPHPAREASRRPVGTAAAAPPEGRRVTELIAAPGHDGVDRRWPTTPAGRCTTSSGRTTRPSAASRPCTPRSPACRR